MPLPDFVDDVLPPGDYELTIQELRASMLVQGFVENKAHPGDIDGYFECPWQEQANGNLETKLNSIDPHTVWTWDWNDRLLYSGKMRLPMWIHYRCELYPHLTGLPMPRGTGITDQYGNDLEFPSAFRQSRGFAPKGIVKLNCLVCELEQPKRRLQ